MRRNRDIVAHKKIRMTHPDDRTVKQVQREMRHNVRILTVDEKRATAETQLFHRVFWFREQLQRLWPLEASDEARAAAGGEEEGKERGSGGITDALYEALIELYIQRNDAEVAALKKQRNVPRGRIRMLEALKEAERDQFRIKGIEVPALRTQEEVEILSEVWDGMQATMRAVPMIRVVARDLASRQDVAALAARLASIDEVRSANPSIKKATERFIDEGRRYSAAPSAAPGGSSVLGTAGITDAATAAKAKFAEADARAKARQTSAKGSASAAATAQRDRQRRVAQQTKSTAIRRHKQLSQSRGLL